MSRMPFRGGMQQGAEMSGGPLQRARLALMNNQPAVAVDICQRRLEKKPSETPTRLMLAQALVQLQRSREAANEARRVLETDPNSVDALMLLSAALMSTNRFNPPKESLTAAQRAVQLQPKNARARVQLAEVLMVQRQFDQASAEADEAVRLDQRLGAAYMVKGMSSLNSKNYDGAEQAFRAALRQDKSMAPAYYGLAQSLSSLNKPEEALEAVNTAQRLNPLLPTNELSQLRAQIYRKQRKYGLAYQEFRQLAGRNNSRFAPIMAGISFALSFFGQAAPAVAFGVVFAVLIAIFFGLSKIPVVGGGVIDVVILALIGYLGWNVVRQMTGGSPLQRLVHPQIRLAAVGALVGGLVVVFGLFALISYFTSGPHHHFFWFTTLSFGLATSIALIAAYAVLYVMGSSSSAKA